MDDLVNDNLDFPFPDAVQEFSAQTSNMGVELGGPSGGVLNIVTKSGTNEFHGNGFWFVRNTELNATNFFSQQQDLLKRNQYGFTAGGPIVKNKLFAFGGAQKLTIRQAAGNNRDQSLTAAERQGDFSSNPITLFDPLTNGTPLVRGSYSVMELPEKSPRRSGAVRDWARLLPAACRIVSFCAPPKAKSLFLMMGPPAVNPYWFRFNRSSDLEKKLLALSAVFRTNQNPLPWNSLVPDLVTMFKTPPECPPSSTPMLLVWALNS
jgi:hypothetical protein